MNKDGAIGVAFDESLGNLIVHHTRTQLPLHDDEAKDKWRACLMKSDRKTIYRDSVYFRNTGKLFTLGGGPYRKINSMILNWHDY